MSSGWPPAVRAGLDPTGGGGPSVRTVVRQPAPAASASRLLLSLAEANARHPTERKLLVCRDRGEGRELLRALARHTGGWVGWEPFTLRDIAGELAFTTLAERGLRTLDDVELVAAADAALDRVVERQPRGGRFESVADAPGFRRAVAGSLEALRLTGWSAADLSRVDFPGSKLSELAAVLREYELELQRRAGVDSAGELAVALDVFDAEMPYFGAQVYLAPGLGRRGRAGELLDRLLSAGASVLESDRVVGLDPPRGVLTSTPRSRGDGADPPEKGRPRAPDQLALEFAPQSATQLSFLHDPEASGRASQPLALEIFHAANPAAEMKEVLRRVIENGWRWDEVEVVATDPDVYGCALDTLASKLDIPVTYGVGLPLDRTRVGRVFRAYLRWLERGLHARPLWEAIAAGDLRTPEIDGARPSGGGAARTLRRLGIGWSRRRYEDVLEAIPRMLEEETTWLLSRADEDLDEGEIARRRAQRRLELRSVERLLKAAVDAIPSGVGRGSPSDPEPRVPLKELAEGALRFLSLFQPRAGAAEIESAERLRERLRRIRDVSERAAPLRVAIAELRSALATLRALPPGTLGRQPWTSAAGALHLTDLAHGGRSQRPHTFVVGLDADRASPLAGLDPLLLEADRRSLNARVAGGGEQLVRELPRTADRIAENRYRLASVLASLRGSVTLSCSAWEAATGSELSPAPVLLQAHRVLKGDSALGFSHLQAALGAPVTQVPRHAAADSTDVWLGALAERNLLLSGEALVRQGFPSLAAGLSAEEARRGDEAGVHHGIVPAAAALDPRTRGTPISPSALQTLARCPLAWFHTYALGLRSPEDAVYVPGRWLDDRERGSLLHAIYERFTREWMTRQDRLREPAAGADLERIVEEELARTRRAVPPASDFAYELESEEIRRSARLFLRQERREGGDGDYVWLEVERSFPAKGEAVVVTLPSGASIKLRGRIDRIDRLATGDLRVIDYKGGRGGFYQRSRDDAPFKGGRQIQAAMYALAVEAMELGRVVSSEYRFPSERGEGRVVVYGREECGDALRVTERLLDLVAAGLFLASDERDDCRYCDHRPICRVQEDPWGRLTSPRTSWSREHRDLPVFAGIRALRHAGR